MAGRTNYTKLANTDPMNGPAQINAVAEHFDELVGQSVPNAAALPATGNWDGRLIFAVAEDRVYRCKTNNWRDVSVLAAEEFTPSPATGWTVLANTTRVRGGIAVVRFSGKRTSGLSAPGVLITVPVGARTDTRVWGLVWGPSGQAAFKVFYDPSVHQVLTNNSLNNGDELSFTLTWDVTG